MIKWRMVSTLFIFLALAGLFSCSAGPGGDLSRPGMPEEIYASPASGPEGGVPDFPSARVGVFPFSAPSYARGTGWSAAEVLCRQLQKSSLFGQTALEPDVHPEAMMFKALERNYDLIITGDILYWFDGSTLEPSRVEQEIQVISPGGGAPRVMWRVRLTETGWPTPPRDLILAITHAVPAPSALALVQKNSEKFCNMLLAQQQKITDKDA